MNYTLGYDLGSSSVKATLLDVASGKIAASATSPAVEMEISSPKPGWAEQHPDSWWDNIKIATQKLLTESGVDAREIGAIGLSYQMHGLVLIDQNHEPLRPAIIWCDSRAVEIGNLAFAQIGPQRCLERLLNSPGNFTASKLKWVKDNEPRIYKKIHKVLLPGDFIAMKMTGEMSTTASGLSEAILWDFQNHQLADLVLDYYGFDPQLIPDRVETFSLQGNLTQQAARELGLNTGTAISYRGGDQPNNALSLNVLNPGEIAATAGTSGVIYGISDQTNYDPKSRVNTFVHLNHTQTSPRYGVLLCINGTGILNSWLKQQVTSGMDYDQINNVASQAPVGSKGLVILPYGNGAERTLENKDIGALVHNLKFNTHTQAHLLRAGQEGIVFALNYGLNILREMGIQVNRVRAGDANMFLSPLFRQAFATTTGAVVELYNTDGSQGAARGAGLGSGIYKNTEEAFANLTCKKIIEPDPKSTAAYQDAYQNWLSVLKQKLQQS
jgi:xylulokinase